MRLVKTDQWCLMFLRAWKNKKIADAVLAQVYPLLNDVGRFARCSPSTLASDKYVLGFFCANIGVEMRRAAGGPLPAVQQGTIMFLVLQQLFGKNAVSASEIGDLLTGSPTPNEEFSRGCDAALKIQAAGSGQHKLRGDPDYLAAREVVRRQGNSLEFLAAGASEDSKVAGEMLRALYYQHVIDHHKG